MRTDGTGGKSSDRSTVYRKTRFPGGEGTAKMAKILVAYASANGMTRACAERLAGELKTTETVLWDLAEGQPDRQGADLLIVGSPVRHGKLLPAAKTLLNDLAKENEGGPVGVFLCCGFSDRFGDYRDRLIPATVRERAFLISDFGGTLDPSRKPFWDRLWLFFARSRVVESEIEDGEYTPILPGMNPESIGQMAEFAKKQLSSREKDEK